LARIPIDCQRKRFGLWTLSVNVIDSLIDLMILALPFQYVLSLDMPPRKRALSLGVFVLGGV